jgi:hypothetical protein
VRRSLETDHIETVLRAYGAPWDKHEVQSTEIDGGSAPLNISSVRRLAPLLAFLACAGMRHILLQRLSARLMTHHAPQTDQPQ